MDATRNDTIVVANEVNLMRNGKGRSISESGALESEFDNAIPGATGFATESDRGRCSSEDGPVSRLYQKSTSHARAITLV